MNRRQLLRKAAAGSLLAGGAASAAPVAGAGFHGCQLLPGAEFYVSIDNKGQEAVKEYRKVLCNRVK